MSVPFDGQVASARGTVGQIVGRDTPLGLVYQNGALQVEAQISQEELASLEPIVGRRATVRAGGREFAASVDRVAAVVDRESRLVTLFLAFRGSPRNLPRPGTFAIVGLGGPALSDVFALPEAAEQPGGHVWVVDGGTLQSVTPETLGRTDAGWLVEAFDPRQGVVVGRVVGARPGLAVRVAE
ncbi:MAG: HlyD family efflux transporter periplasmic adaptor subunit [Acidobacteriota bacterium]|nr:HlyD family efflux transporter periplasmic adaptor subunit [Acidobacteriota bacterium]